VEEAGAAFRAWSVARNRIGERGQALETNPEVVNDPVWRADFEEALTSLEKAAQGLRALPPPAPGYEAVAEAGPQLADLTDALVRDLRAMLAGDAAALEAAGKQLKQADAAHNAALRVLRGFQ
jgi:hypothetical protein